MPNWCFINIQMKDAEKRLTKTKIVKDENGKEVPIVVVDFNDFIPQPTRKEDCPVNFLLDEQGLRVKDHTDPHLCLDEDRPWFNWYDWNCANWWTKWNACNAMVREDGSVSFDTAWTVPIPVLLEISKRYPDDTMTVIADFEMEFCYDEITIKNGEILNTVTTDYMNEIFGDDENE